MALESAAIAHEVGWTWWEAGQLASAAALERERGISTPPSVMPCASLELALGLGDRRIIVFGAAELAIIAAEAATRRGQGFSGGLSRRR